MPETTGLPPMPTDGRRYYFGSDGWVPIEPMTISATEEQPMTATPDTAASGWLEAGWMQTFTGKAFYPMNPRVEDIDIRDIAHALSMICRYGGHTRHFYSVAEHCWLMSYAVPREHALWALLHDAAEAYIGDMVRPIKYQDSMTDYRFVDRALTAAIARKFGTPGDLLEIPEAVHQADARILLDERTHLLTTPPADWAVEDLQPLGVSIRAWAPDVAEVFYLQRFHELTDGAFA